MALLVWFTMGIALWHFTVFLPDRFWQGIVGAFVGAVIGAIVFGAIVEVDHRQGARRHRPGDRADRDSRGRDRPRPSSGRSASAPSASRELAPLVRKPQIPRVLSGSFAAVRRLPSLGGWPKPSRHIAAEPYSYAEARALAERLELSEPVAITLVRRGYRTPEQARAFLEADESHDPGGVRLDGGGRRAGPRRRSRPASGSPSTATSTSTASARRRSWSAPCASSAPSATG